MPDTADTPHAQEPARQRAALQRDIALLAERGQQAGISLYEIALMLLTTGSHALGHAVGETPPPEGPELIQEVLQQLQQEAETCYFQHWR